jgi:hypothetical protein
MSEINLEFLLGAIPPGEATLYRVLIQLIPAPSAKAPNQGGRQIEMAEFARLTGYSKRWVNELMQRLEKKNFIRTDGGSGAVKWIWLLPPGVPRLGRPYPTKIWQRKKTSPGEAKAPRAAASQSERRRQETTPSLEPVADVNVAPSVEKPVEIPSQRRKEPTPSILPAKPAPDNPVVLATLVIPSPQAPADPTLPAAMMPPPSSSSPGGPASSNPVVTVTSVTPAPSRARGGSSASKPAVRAAKIAPPSIAAPGDLAAGNVAVIPAMMPPAPSAAPDGPAAGIPVVRRAAKIAPPPAPGNPVMPAARVTPPHPAAPVVPAKRFSRGSTKKLPAGRSHWESAPIEELVAYACSLSFTPEQIRDLKTPGMTGGLLLLALERLCQRIERDGRKPYPDRWSLVGALRTIRSDL